MFVFVLFNDWYDDEWCICIWWWCAAAFLAIALAWWCAELTGTNRGGGAENDDVLAIEMGCAPPLTIEECEECCE